jgi:UDP-glucose 4-epimerase
MKPTILVTGGAGYIGSHAVLALLDSGYGVVVLDNLVTGFDWLVDKRAIFVNGAVEDDALVRQICAAHGISGVLHFAGSVVVPESVENPLKYYRNNTASTRSLLEAVVGAGVKHFIFSSTAATYGIPDEVPVKENTPRRPINPYGMSKLMSEYMLADVAAAHNFNFCALRYFNVAGADPQGRSGQATIGATHLIKIAVEVACGKRAQMAVYGTDFDTPDGTGVRDYIHVSDLAAAHVLALEALYADPKTSHTLNCGYGKGYSVLEVIRAVQRVTNHEIKHTLEGRRAGDPDCLISDNAAILERFKWKPQYNDLDVIVRDALAWERGLEQKLRG